MFWGLFTQITKLRQPIVLGFIYPNHSTPATDCFGVPSNFPGTFRRLRNSFLRSSNSPRRSRKVAAENYQKTNVAFELKAYGLFSKSLNSGNRLFWGTLKFSWYFSATAELLPLVVKQSSSFPKSSRRKLSENKCCFRVEDLLNSSQNLSRNDISIKIFSFFGSCNFKLFHKQLIYLQIRN